MSKNILITGGSGLVGMRLSELLAAKGYQVAHVTRSVKSSFTKYRQFAWDLNKGYLEPEALHFADSIIHLAGAGVADSRWTDSRKKEILDSRVQSTQLLYNSIANAAKKPDAFISASAVGYYGFTNSNDLFKETDKPGDDFLAKVTKAWEKEIFALNNLNVRTVALRIGVVLSQHGGALPQMALPIKLFAGAPLGSGKQINSWIGLDDLCNMFIYMLENPITQGVYNAVAQQPISNKVLTKAIAKQLHRPVWPLNVPTFLLKLLLGEMSVIISGSCGVANHRIKTETNFKYQHNRLSDCLKACLG
jgi:uncharacterized protein